MSPSPLSRFTIRRALCSVLAVALIACSGEVPTDAAGRLRVERVVLVSVDGLRADALDSMPSLAALRASALWTDDARSVLPAVTVPAHLSLLTGRDVTTLGIRDNAFDQGDALAMMLAGATPVFRWIEGTSEAVIGASLLPPEDLEAARAFFGVRRLTATSLDDDAIVDAAILAATATDAPALLFVHLPEVDLAGHAHGWIRTGSGGEELGAEYLAAVRAADAAIARLHAVLAPAIASGRLALLVTADHGGGHGVACAEGMPPEREHCTAHAADQSVPLVLVARDLVPRRLAGVVPITSVGPTVAALLGSHLPAGVTPPVIE